MYSPAVHEIVRDSVSAGTQDVRHENRVDFSNTPLQNENPDAHSRLRRVEFVVLLGMLAIQDALCQSSGCGGTSSPPSAPAFPALAAPTACPAAFGPFGPLSGSGASGSYATVRHRTDSDFSSAEATVGLSSEKNSLQRPMMRNSLTVPPSLSTIRIQVLLSLQYYKKQFEANEAGAHKNRARASPCLAV
jgi:hypothetical protein